MKLEKLKIGDTIYSVSKNTSLFRSKYNTYAIKVLEIDLVKQQILVSFNGNPARWVTEYHWSKYRYSPPKK